VIVVAGTRAERSRYASATVALPNPTDDVAGFTTAVIDAVHRDGVDVVAPATDASVEALWSIADELGPTRILGGDRRSAALALEKGAALAAAVRHGFSTPAWIAPRTIEDAVAALDVTGVPAVLKPHRSYLREGNRLRQRRHRFANTAAEVERESRLLLCADGRLPIVQAFVPGRSLSVSAVLQGSVVVGLAARETLSFEPLAGGNSVWKRTIAPDDVGVQEAVDLLRAVDYEGLAEVEYQVDASGVPRLMEIGARLHGWVPLAVHAGVDLPLIAARALVGETLPESSAYRVGAEMRWPAGELARLRAAFARNAALPPDMSRLSVLARAWPPWRPGMAYDGFDLGDPGPWFGAVRKGRGRRAAR
jgi:biotin carboxylase